MDVKTLQSMITEKINSTRIGQEHDNYLMHAIKCKAFESVIYLLTLPNAKFEFIEKNGSGNSVLHLAVKTGQLKYVKAVI